MGSAQEVVSALARKCVDVLRRQGAGGQWTSQCVCYMLSQHDVVRSGIACGLLEGWLTSEGSARKVRRCRTRTTISSLSFAPTDATALELRWP